LEKTKAPIVFDIASKPLEKKHSRSKMGLACFAFPLILLGSFCLAADAKERLPNILVVLTDDQGWGDLSHHGNPNLATPNLDSIAKDGAEFQNFYVCQVCAPTRAEFLTGRYYPRTGVSGVSLGQERMNADEMTLANVLHDAGYATGAFGKWHNGSQSPLHPNDRGFDEYYGFTSGHWGHYFSPPLDHNGEFVRGKGYVVDDFTNHAIAFMEQNRERPFFCYVPLNTPHSPMMIGDRFYDKFADTDPALKHRDVKREDVMMTRAALAMVENIDWNVGRMLQTLERLGIEDETIVIYFSDNGPNSYRWNGGMKGRKGAIDEGGLRSPLFVRWSNHIRSGVMIREIAGAIDLMPTIADLAGVGVGASKSIDGRSLRGLLTESLEDWKPRELFAIKNDQVSVRSQRFRLDSDGKLFDIEVDRGQRKDVSQEHPNVTARLTQLAESHAQSMSVEFEKNRKRPFHVGYSESTWLPARDGTDHGDVKRSVKSPNNSFFEKWTSVDGSITWWVDVMKDADYEVTLRYTCSKGNEGAVIQLACEPDVDSSVAAAGAGTVGMIASTSAAVKQAYDPPLYDKSLERVEQSHYFVKDFRAMSLGNLHLGEGTWILRLSALEIPGAEAVDVHSIELTRK
jgi:arylsulfatase A-like enzyme